MKRLLVTLFVFFGLTSGALACATKINVPAGCSCVNGQVVCP